MKIPLRNALILAAVTPWLSGGILLAQTVPSEARKFDEFGDILPTDVAARLDNFAISLQSEPESRAFIIAYRSWRDLPGLSRRRADWMGRYLLYRGFNSNRIEVLNVGTASCLRFEFWIAPPGAKPKLQEDANPNEIVDTRSLRKYDEYFWDAPNDLLVSYSSEYSDSLVGFAEALRKNRRSVAYVIVYRSYDLERYDDDDKSGYTRKGRRVFTDSLRTARDELRRNRTVLVRNYGIASSRVKLIYGGYRTVRGIELWLGPLGGHPPIPSPTVFPLYRTSSKSG